MPALVRRGNRTKKVTPKRYVIDCSIPVQDNILDTAPLQKYLQDRIKVNGKTGQLGDVVVVAREGAARIVVTANIEFSKRYFKYLARKYLKKREMRDFMRIVSSGRDTYQLRYYNVGQAEAQSEGEAEGEEDMEDA
ncbi:hypothetical protein CDCA_CDCA17G4414 [Cyanidium caldarium]|uniref:Large ribosomal subunit protein eL22 n=1 Tax=Cyanidium caldarium TaxID=2771 RepID=A0AAV9J1G3_CYACA|nr:hypothetical protein CDCA_CDCA17G4414 [Cyanidium caldarium]